jgi:hypothetical protein
MTTISPRGDWFIYTIGGGVILSVAAAVVAATITSTPAEPSSPTHTATEH